MPSGGAFAEWQPRYAEVGIATYPVLGKAPAVANYQRIGRPGSASLVRRFREAEAFGFAAKPARIVVLDIDTPDESLLDDALKRHGSTPFIVRTGSGNHQAWYRRTEEPRLIRPFTGLPIDVLGDGNVVAPPSQAGHGRYEIIAGSLADLQRLPPMQNGPVPIATPSALSGARNTTLWRYCMLQARHCDDFDTLLDVARTANDGFFPALDDAEILKIVRSAWGYTERGENRFGRKHIRIAVDLFDELFSANQDAILLLAALRRTKSADPFQVANSMAESMGGWSRRRFAAARKQLLLSGAIVEIHSANSWYGPALYRWGT